LNREGVTKDSNGGGQLWGKAVLLADGLRAAARSRSALVIVGSVGVGILFKLAAFVREAYIAAKFGLSGQMDAYFAFQQLPFTLMSFMGGAFCVAFVPAFAKAKQHYEGGRWLTAILNFTLAAAVIATVVCITGAPLLAKLAGQAVNAGASVTLRILSLSFVPVVLIGICAGMCLGMGRNITAMVVQGLAYLIMAIALISMCTIWGADQLSLPVSMTLGFALIGLASLIFIVAKGNLRFDRESLFHPLRTLGMRTFLTQLSASATETVGYLANQLLAVWFLSRAASGAVTANNYAMRIGMLSLSLFSLPLSQLAQARMCVVVPENRKRVLIEYLLIAVAMLGPMAILQILLRTQLVSLVYMRGKFSAADLAAVCSFIPAWVMYVLVMTANFLLGKYEFATQQGGVYARRMWWAYGAVTGLRFAVHGWTEPNAILWCAVFAEGVAFLVGFSKCLAAGIHVEDAVSVRAPSLTVQAGN
jgi:putative peptidoglycan lipid II flippase